jgi:hypothetical protein
VEPLDVILPPAESLGRGNQRTKTKIHNPPPILLAQPQQRTNRWESGKLSRSAAPRVASGVCAMSRKKSKTGRAS